MLVAQGASGSCKPVRASRCLVHLLLKCVMYMPSACCKPVLC